MKTKLTQEQREQRAAKRQAKWRADHVVWISKIMLKARYDGKFDGMPPDRKRWTVEELTRHGLTVKNIHEVTGFSEAFCYDAIRDFAHKALVTAVKESANGSA